MGRNKGEKNIMRTPEEKEKIIFDYFNSGKGAMEFERESGVSRKSLWKWIKILHIFYHLLPFVSIFPLLINCHFCGKNVKYCKNKNRVIAHPVFRKYLIQITI